ncbi:MAG: hypothetical protein V3U09_08265 [Thermoplasmata archaeon]
MFGYEENHKERIQATRYVTFRKKERVAERKKETPSFARVFVTPDAAAKLLELSSGTVSPPRNPLPVIRTSIVRKPRRSVPVVFAQKEAHQTEGPHELQVRRQARPMLREKAEVQDTSDFVDTTRIKREDTKVSTEGLRRFVLEKLPKESVLREVILSGKEELTAEEFMAKMEVWLVLFNHEN